MRDLLGPLFSTEFMPHGHCYLWKPGLVWLHVVSDFSIGIAYVSITLMLLYIVKRIRALPFSWVFIAFGVFIVTCGFTHFLDVWTVWTPVYWFDGVMRALTALASVATALVLLPLLPKAIALGEAAALARERGVALESANKELGELYAKTKELERLKTQLFANVSHELRTPLALIMGPTEKLLATPELAAHRQDLEVIARSARMLLKHVNDLLDVSKLEAGRMTVDWTAIDLAQLVRRAASCFDALAAERAIAFSVETPESLPAQLDGDQVERVLINVISNAFKFTPGGGRVRVALAASGGRAAIAVADSGPGVLPDERAVIFERFRQGDGGSTRQHGGTGLGLAIAKDLVELHQGSIAVDGAPEGGARFTVELPLVAPPGSTVRAPAPESERGVAASAALDELRARVDAVAARGGARGTVLVVEDNPEMRRFLVESLADEYQVVSAIDGQEGIDKALADPPDLIVSDVMMPRLSGDQLLRALRDRRSLDDTPIVMLTAKADDELRVQLLKEGAQDYVMKPFSVEELRARVGNLVTMKRAREVLRRELQSQLGDLEELAREVTLRKQELHSTVEALRVARDQAERAAMVKSDFLRLVSHELRTPMTTLQLQLERLERAQSELTPKQRDVVHLMDLSSRRLVELIESLLEYARLQSGRLTTHIEPLELPLLVDGVVEEMRPQADNKRLKLGRSLPPQLVPLRSDARLVRLILSNLVSNAIKYTDEGEIAIDVSQEDDTTEIAVRDTGPGIPADRQALVFEPFEQLEPLDKKHRPGVGLGLSLVREMVNALGGAIQLRSQPGSGSTFIVTLRAVESEDN
jgi:signal transduction histidine kinase